MLIYFELVTLTIDNVLSFVPVATNINDSLFMIWNLTDTFDQIA